MTADIIKFKPKSELDCEKAVESVLNAADDLKALLCKPVDTAASLATSQQISTDVQNAAYRSRMRANAADTAPSEYSAPDDGDCA